MQAVDFDNPAQICVELDWVTRLTALYLFFSCIALIAIVIRNWWILGIRSSPIRKKLQAVHDSLHRKDVADLRPLSLRFRASSLEAGVRQWAEVKQFDQFALLLKQADFQFKSKARQFKWSLKNLSRWRNGTLFVLASYAASALTNVFLEISHQKAPGIGVVSGGVGKIGLMLSLGIWFLTALFFFQWHFSSRIHHRVQAWSQFTTEVKQCIS